ncbi:MAG TPA: tRNA 2-thiouridine(34) synthase MnmA [Candidatus Absconditabacterales bacterium]|nr:tRNA 2-thiouridine(34) synthase MnmA [Candidatus Absconditabacterales bacterium]
MKKILMGLSGGVDSAVAAWLLKEKGYEVVAGFMKNYVDEDNPSCSTYQDAKEAIKVAEFLGLEIMSFDLRDEYEEKIVKYIYEGYKNGITPNPDILCNSLIKFDVFLDKAIELGFDGIAMGHYARIDKKDDGNHRLLRGIDYNKDQSYFLSGLNQYQLSKALFPIGGMKKSEVRNLAKKIGLPNADRKDSQGLCFIGKVPMKEFLKKRLPIKKGDIVLVDGTKVGEHEGAYFFTIGQSRGLDINKKAYVVNIDVEKNLVIVSYDKNEPELSSKEISVKNWHWIGKEYELPLKCKSKIRYRQEPQNAELRIENGKLKFICKEKQWGIAPGQSVVAYVGDECVGGGIIV